MGIKLQKVRQLEWGCLHAARCLHCSTYIISSWLHPLMDAHFSEIRASAVNCCGILGTLQLFPPVACPKLLARLSCIFFQLEKKNLFLVFFCATLLTESLGLSSIAFVIEIFTSRDIFTLSLSPLNFATFPTTIANAFQHLRDNIYYESECNAKFKKYLIIILAQALLHTYAKSFVPMTSAALASSSANLNNPTAWVSVVAWWKD